MWGAISGTNTGGMTSNHCFVAGTMIQTLEGEVPIEEIQEGQYVLSTDENTGDTTYKRVLETYVRDEYRLVHLVIDGEIITTTEEHPFFVSDKGWIIAKELAINDRLVSSDGREKTVSFKSIQELENPVKVYNFAVEDYHTYYVGSGVLVHNMCTTNSQGKVSNPGSMQTEVVRGKAPKGVKAVHNAHDTVTGKPHIHFGENFRALNIDGTWLDGGKKIPKITKAIAKWITKHGWKLPKH